MVNEICFATNNPNKLKEIKSLLPDRFKILSLEDIHCEEELPETHETLHENSREKALFIFNHYGYNCFADDTGLEVHALKGEPGVYSARYAGPAKSSTDNMGLLLKNLQDKNDRRAQFRTVITLIFGGREKQFEGVVTGKILETPHGEQGFGYDPVFQPDGYEQSFAEMDLQSKNAISHRGKAINKLVEYLNSL